MLRLTKIGKLSQTYTAQLEELLLSSTPVWNALKARRRRRRRRRRAEGASARAVLVAAVLVASLGDHRHGSGAAAALRRAVVSLSAARGPCAQAAQSRAVAPRVPSRQRASRG